MQARHSRCKRPAMDYVPYRATSLQASFAVSRFVLGHLSGNLPVVPEVAAFFQTQPWFVKLLCFHHEDDNRAKIFTISQRDARKMESARIIVNRRDQS